jgi:ABC-type branched-subunit amino acid transport system ATPase component
MICQTDADAPLLGGRDVCARFGEIPALDRVSFDVRQGQICGVAGPNGANNTTLFNSLSRIEVMYRGRISVRGGSFCPWRSPAPASIQQEERIVESRCNVFHPKWINACSKLNR